MGWREFIAGLTLPLLPRGAWAQRAPTLAVGFLNVSSPEKIVRAIGVTFPLTLLGRADVVIE
jgi:hypothetical protein